MKENTNVMMMAVNDDMLSEVTGGITWGGLWENFKTVTGFIGDAIDTAIDNSGLPDLIDAIEFIYSDPRY